MRAFATLFDDDDDDVADADANDDEKASSRSLFVAPPHTH